MIDWRARLFAAEARLEKWTRLAEHAFQQAASRKRMSRAKRAEWIRKGERYARLADIAAEDVRHIQARLYRIGQRRQKRLQSRVRMYEEDEEDDVYAEWEFGFEYIAADYRDDTHNVDVNFRVRREDGRPFRKDTAEQVMRYVAEHRGRIPRGYVVAGVNWRSPKKSDRWKRGTLHEVLSGPLVNVLDTVASDPKAWRLGNPKW